MPICKYICSRQRIAANSSLAEAVFPLGQSSEHSCLGKNQREVSLPTTSPDAWLDISGFPDRIQNEICKRLEAQSVVCPKPEGGRVIEFTRRNMSAKDAVPRAKNCPEIAVLMTRITAVVDSVKIRRDYNAR